MNNQNHQQQEKIAKLKNLLEQEKQEFLAVMSHELRTPMTGVKGYLSMILEGDAGPVPEDIKEYVAQAYVANDRLIRLVNHMAKVVSLQEGTLKFDFSKVNFSREAKLVVGDFQMPAQLKKQNLTYLGPGEDLFVKADPDRAREILMNLISNAIKFTPEGGEINILQRASGEMVITDVKDTGIGIGREDQDRLFQVFTKGNLTLTGQERGTGLGLYLARQLAEAQGGKLWLESSELGKGSVFSLSLPKF